MTPTRTRAAAAILAASALAACGGAARSSAGAPAPAAAPSAGQAPRGELDPVAQARADSLRHPYTAADIHFMTAMIGHHAQAIRMARMVPSHGASPAVRTLAERIINAQRDEIASMQGWLRDRRLPVPQVSETGEVTGMPPMPMHGAADSGAHAGMHAMHGAAPDSAAGRAMRMPGMLTEAQMRELDAARGAEFDRLFLVDMIQHHRGATTMVRDLFGSYGAGQDERVFKLASDINVDQETEIARMEKMLVALVLGDGSP